MLSFRIRGGLTEANTFLKELKVFTLAESLGAVESLAELPWVATRPVSRRDRGATVWTHLVKRVL